MKFRLDLVAIATRAVEVSQDELRAFMAKEYPGQTVPADDDEDAWGEVAYEFMHGGTLGHCNGWDSWLNDESEVTLL